MKSTLQSSELTASRAIAALCSGGCGLLKVAFDAVVFQLCGQRPVAEIAELIADLLSDLSGSVMLFAARAGRRSRSRGWCWVGSWGSTLALAYAERHARRVTEMVLAASPLTQPGSSTG
jgi:alpha-beta hydrolase superfamily lysophospholipase